MSDLGQLHADCIMSSSYPICLINNSALSWFFLLKELLLFSPFSTTSWVSWCQKGKPLWFCWSKRRWGGSGISWTICKSFAPRFRRTTMPALSFLWARFSSCHPTNSVRALKACQNTEERNVTKTKLCWWHYNVLLIPVWVMWYSCLQKLHCMTGVVQ